MRYGREGRRRHLSRLGLQELTCGSRLSEELVQGSLEGGHATAHHLLHLHREVLDQDGGRTTDDAAVDNGGQLCKALLAPRHICTARTGIATSKNGGLEMAFEFRSCSCEVKYQSHIE